MGGNSYLAQHIKFMDYYFPQVCNFIPVIAIYGQKRLYKQAEGVVHILDFRHMRMMRISNIISSYTAFVGGNCSSQGFYATFSVKVKHSLDLSICGFLLID